MSCSQSFRNGGWDASVELEEERARVGRRDASIEAKETELEELRGQVDWRNASLQQQEMELNDVEDEVGELQNEVNKKEHGMDRAQLQQEGEVLCRAMDTRSKSEGNSDNGAGANEEEQLAQLRQDLRQDLADRSRCGSRSSLASAEDPADESPSGDDSVDGFPQEDRALMERLRRAADVLRRGTEEAEDRDEGTEVKGNWTATEAEAEAEQAASRRRAEWVGAEDDDYQILPGSQVMPLVSVTDVTDKKEYQVLPLV
ncbi:hypothetical protein B484DRAFT_402960 [Ochromonadaceae sp. CCMP2298]|nr:hypothetical protein B484DRAFT_402960 [Ochromonadaceae sp. CCMP2298]